MRLSAASTTIALSAALAAAAGCGASDQEVRDARTSGYRTDFAIVYSETLAAVRELYPRMILADNARLGTIETAWYPINVRTGSDDPRSTSSASQQGRGASALTGPVGEREVQFLKFDIAVVGGNPWRVRVHARASSYRAGDAIPAPLKGAATPPWLEGRKSALEVAIYKRLRRYAVRLKYRRDAAVARQAAPVDLGKFGAVPKAAAQLIGQVERAAGARDTGRLRPLMAEAFTYSLGDAPSADTAILVWQADPSVVDELARAVGAGCAQDGRDGQVVCPAASVRDPGFTGYRAGFKQVGGAWKMVYFVTGD